MHGRASKPRFSWAPEQLEKASLFPALYSTARGACVEKDDLQQVRRRHMHRGVVSTSRVCRFVVSTALDHFSPCPAIARVVFHLRWLCSRLGNGRPVIRASTCCNLQASTPRPNGQVSPHPTERLLKLVQRSRQRPPRFRPDQL